MGRKYGRPICSFHLHAAQPHSVCHCTNDAWARMVIHWRVGPCTQNRLLPRDKHGHVPRAPRNWIRRALLEIRRPLLRFPPNRLYKSGRQRPLPLARPYRTRPAALSRTAKSGKKTVAPLTLPPLPLGACRGGEKTLTVGGIPPRALYAVDHQCCWSYGHRSNQGARGHRGMKTMRWAKPPLEYVEPQTSCALVDPPWPTWDARGALGK
jgi:hypothetical protein